MEKLWSRAVLLDVAVELGVAEEGGGSKRQRRARSGKREREHQGRGESSRE